MRTALLIGNTEFPATGGTLRRLNAPRNDLRRLADLLRKEICGFDVKQPLLDSDASTIRSAVNHVMQDARPEDLVLIYYAGHGKLNWNQLYLCTRDTNLGLLPSTALPVRDICDMVRNSSCDKVVLILDCCFSGAVLDQLLARGDEDVASIVKKTVDARGWHVLTSSDVHEPSYETGEGDQAHGIYTKCLIDGIATGAADLNRDGTITPPELAEYAAARIRNQTPQASHIGSTGNAPVIARNPWTLDDPARRKITRLLTRWGTELLISPELYRIAVRLVKQEPLNPVETNRKKLLLNLSKSDRWESVFVPAWNALGAEDGADLAFPKWLTEEAIRGQLPEGVYLSAMDLLQRDPANAFEDKRKRLLQLFSSTSDWEVPEFVESWNSTERREPKPNPDELDGPQTPNPEGPQRDHRRRQDDPAPPVPEVDRPTIAEEILIPADQVIAQPGGHATERGNTAQELHPSNQEGGTRLQAPPESTISAPGGGVDEFARDNPTSASSANRWMRLPGWGWPPRPGVVLTAALALVLFFYTFWRMVDGEAAPAEPGRTSNAPGIVSPSEPAASQSPPSLAPVPAESGSSGAAANSSVTLALPTNADSDTLSFADVLNVTLDLGMSAEDEEAIRALVVSADSLTAIAKRSRDTTDLPQVYTGSALRQYAAEIRGLEREQLVSIDELIDRSIGKPVKLAPDSAEVVVNETWVVTTRRADGSCLTILGPVTVEQMLTLRLTSQGWRISRIAERGSAREPRACT